MTFKRVNDFATDDPARLDRELSQLEGNIAAEFDSLDKAKAPSVSVDTYTARVLEPTRSICPNQQLSVDTGSMSGMVVFPAPDPSFFGKPFIIIKRYAGNSIVCSCADPTVTRNGTTFPTITAVGMTTFRCDATGYYT